MPQLTITPGVYFIGAGPGDPELLTRKAEKVIAAADVLLYADSLLPSEILSGAKPGAEIIPTSALTLEAIVLVMVHRVRSHLVVARLHSGDPSLYSTLHEQSQALIAAGIPFQVIPGISTFQLAAARLGLELTVPGLVQSVILTRASGRASPVPETLANLAAHRASLCLYLSAKHVATAQADLLTHYPGDTPVAICFRLGWPDEQIQITRLQDLATTTKTLGLTRTTLYVISPALGTSSGGRSQLYQSPSA